jgi:hypothetical protein
VFPILREALCATCLNEVDPNRRTAADQYTKAPPPTNLFTPPPPPSAIRSVTSVQVVKSAADKCYGDATASRLTQEVKLSVPPSLLNRNLQQAYKKKRASQQAGRAVKSKADISRKSSTPQKLEVILRCAIILKRKARGVHGKAKLVSRSYFVVHSVTDLSWSSFTGSAISQQLFILLWSLRSVLITHGGCCDSIQHRS